MQAPNSGMLYKDLSQLLANHAALYGAQKHRPMFTNEMHRFYEISAAAIANYFPLLPFDWYAMVLPAVLCPEPDGHLTPLVARTDRLKSVFRSDASEDEIWAACFSGWDSVLMLLWKGNVHGFSFWHIGVYQPIQFMDVASRTDVYGACMRSANRYALALLP